MLTLQSTFQYDCSSSPPVGQVDIALTYPKLEPAAPPDDAVKRDVATAPLVLAGRGSLTFLQYLAEKRYYVSIPTANVFGNDYGTSIVGHLRYVLGKSFSNRPRLSDFTLSFSASYGGNVAEQSRDQLSALYFLKALTARPPPVVLSAVASEMASSPTDSPGLSTAKDVDITANLEAKLVTGSVFRATGWEGIIDANLYLVNKPAYLRVLGEIFPNLAGTNRESILLYILNALVDLSGPSPSFSADSEATTRQQIATLLKAFDLSTRTDVYAHVAKNFSALFDFTLKMPCVRLLTIAGKLRVRNKPALTSNDFALYHLSSEFTTGTTKEAAKRNVRRYGWDPSKVSGDSVNFYFPESHVVQSHVNGPVTVRVKGFDGSQLWATELRATDPALRTLEIIVDWKSPGLLNDPAGTGSVRPSLKLRGKVVSLVKRCGGLQGVVVVQAKKEDADDWVAVASGESDQAGNFTLSYPFGPFVAAQAISSLDSFTPTPVAMNPTRGDQSISTDFIIILLTTGDEGTSSGSKNTGDCSCAPQHTAGRLPTQEDLIQSDQYTQDVGGSCLNLKTPNRLLREYSYTALVRTSDPDVANYTLSSGTDASGRRVFTVTGHGKVTRKAVDLDNPILWQDVPDSSADASLYQAVTVATGHVLHFRAEFRADGYSLGDLLFALPLGPGQKKHIVVMDASHDLVGTETQTTSQAESLASNLVSERTIVDQIAGSLGETLAGWSSASNEGVSAGLGVAGSYGGMVGGSLGVAGGYSRSNASASQSGKRDLSQFFSEVLRQGVMQSADSHRKLNASVVTAVREGQQYRAETDVVANHNHCHSMTMMYFEVLRHFAVFQELVDVQECLFVPLLMTKFSAENIPKWRDVLAPRLRALPSNTYLKPYTFFHSRPQHPLLPAFDALERVKTNWSQVDYPDTTFDQDPVRWIEGELVLNTSIPRPRTRYDFILSLPIITKTVNVQVTDVRSVVKTVVLAYLTAGLSLLAGDDGSRTETREIEARGKLFDEWFELDANFETVPPRDCIRFKSFGSYTVPNVGSLLDPITLNIGPDDRRMWTFMARALGYAEPSDNEAIRSLLTYYYKGQLLAEWDTIFLSQIAPRVFKAIVGRLVLDVGSLDFTALTNYTGGQRNMRITFSGTSSKRRFEITNMKLSCELTALGSLGTSPIILNIVSLRVAYSTQHYRGLLYSGSVKGDLADGQLINTPESEDEKRNPRKEDVFLTDRLIDHLNYHMEYYNRMLWFSLDTERRFMLLDGFDIETYDKYGAPEGLRSLSSVLKNQLITVAGNALVLPVAPGFRASQALVVRTPRIPRTPAPSNSKKSNKHSNNKKKGKHSNDNESGEQCNEESEEAEDDTPPLLDHYRPAITPPPYRISTPTKGVFMEAIMGSCNACEKVQPDSSQDWAKFTTDEPSAIAAVNPPVPTVTDWKAAFKDFAPPLINIQNAPAAPEPGAGLAAAGISQLLGKGDAFRDAMGLSATQASAIQTYLSNQENAKAFAQMAAGMAMQAHNTGNSTKIMDTLRAANETGALSDTEYRKLVKDHLQQQIDGGQSLQVDLDKQRQENQKKPTLADVAASAESKNKAVKAARTDGNGQAETVEVIGAGAPRVVTVAKVEGLVPALRQQKLNDCWAVATAMMVDWKDQASHRIEDTLRIAGEQYVTKYTNDTGLSAEEKGPFIDNMGMTAEPPASYTINTYVDLMQRYGPLWVTTDSAFGLFFSPHARILVEIASDGDPTGENTTFTFLNPATGRREDDSFPDFLLAYERMATHSQGKLYLQIVHFSTEIPSPPAPGREGASPTAALADWMDLVRFKTPLPIVTGLAARKITVQRIEDAGGDNVNLDYYPVKIDAFPSLNGAVLTPEALVEHIRKNLNRFIDPKLSSFWPLDRVSDDALYNSTAPLGAVMGITINPDNGAVVVGDHGPGYWRFLTVRTPFRQTGSHPVSGTREFGIRSVGGEGGMPGVGVFYTRGADRTTQWPETWLSGTAFSRGKKLWLSLQRKVADWINAEGGNATVMQFIQKEVPWEDIKKAI